MSRDHSQNHYGPNASFDGYDSDLASAGMLIDSLQQQLAECRAEMDAFKQDYITETQLHCGTGQVATKLLAQLAECQAVIEGLKGRFEKDQDRIACQAQQLAECQAVLAVKNEALRAANHSCVEDWPLLREALALQPGTEALEKWLGEPAAWVWERRYSNGGYSREVCQFKSKALELAEDGKNLPIPDTVAPLYAPKGLK